MRRVGTVGGHTYEFPTLVELMAKATPARSGDVLAGCAAESAAERVAAQTVLADLPLVTFLDEQVVGYDEDDVTRLVLDTHDPAAFAPVASLTVGSSATGCWPGPPRATRRRSAGWRGGSPRRWPRRCPS